MSVSERLSLYAKRPSPTPSPMQSDADEAIVGIGAQRLEHRGQFLYRFRESQPIPDLLAGSALGNAPLIADCFMKHAGIGPVPPERLLFFDCETTALSIGTGNYAFLTGFGYIQGNDFVTEQFFMDSYEREPAILSYILRYFTGFEAIVTFNGKTFDLPLIKNRYRMNRVPGFPLDLVVIDLLHASRRLFRKVYESLSLASLEERLLGIKRTDDIPGWMIPDVFFSYQKYGAIDRIADVVRHNRIDLSSMLLLMLSLDGIYTLIENKEYRALARPALVNAAKYLYTTNHDLFLDIVRFLGDDMYRLRPLYKRYITLLKRRGDLRTALSVLERDRSAFSQEELAKHYEHREKNFPRALEYATAALALQEAEDRAGSPADRNRLQRRIRRLTQKAARPRPIEEPHA